MTKYTVKQIDREIEVTVTEREPDGYYRAWFGDYDLDITTGSGRTPLDAIVDLLDQTEG